MANIIAVIWDCDKTLIDGYMQDPIFKEFNMDGHKFWKEMDEIVAELEKSGKRINKDTYYLNHFIHCAQDGTFPGLDNQMLRDFGKMQKFYPGVPEIFEKTKMICDDQSYSEYGIKVEHYIVSTGFAEVIRGSVLAEHMEDIWGCELIEREDCNGNKVIGEAVYTIDNTTKTRAIFEINKGKGIDVNAKIPKELRRVQFENMIYIADGPSDIPAFSLVKQNGGSTFAIYPKGDMKAMQQVENMRQNGRVDMYAEADYSEETTAFMWISNAIKEKADKIRDREKNKILNSVSCVPKHLT